MQVELVDYTPDPETKIANAAAVCYGADNSPDANKKRIVRLMQYGHMSPLRFAYATFHIAGISRVESHQHVRVAHAGILQRSQRYTRDSEHTVFPPSFTGISKQAFDALAIAELAAHRAYQCLLSEGIPLEDARYVLPQGTSTELFMTGNFQMWHGWLNARSSEHAQWEIRAVAARIKELLFTIAPNVFNYDPS